MVSAGIVEIHGAFDQTQAEHIGIKIKVTLWRPSNRCNVMET